MKERASKFADLGNLQIYTCSKEDIFLFKALASVSRTRDLEDLDLLYTSGLDWKIIRTEIIRQSNNFDPKLSVYFIETINLFQDQSEITIPKEFLKPIQELAEKTQLDAFVKTYLSEGKSSEEIVTALAEIFDKKAIMEAILKHKRK
jgi:nucleotide-binding universal stress UspA family protein